MPYIPRLIKQPAESRLYTMEFAPLLNQGESIASVTSVTDNSAGDLTLSGATYSGTKASVRIAGGTAGKTWKVTFLVTTDAGNTLEAEGDLRIQEL